MSKNLVNTPAEAGAFFSGIAPSVAFLGLAQESVTNGNRLEVK